MKALLDTNIVIHRETNQIMNQDIGTLFKWMDKGRYTKCIHPITISEIERYKDKAIVKTFKVKLDSYDVLKTIAPLSPEVEKVSSRIDKNENDSNDTLLLNELFNNRVDLLITEDRKIHYKAALLGLSDLVFTIDSFLEKVVSENPDLVDYHVLSVTKKYFGEIDLTDSFFDSFREDYLGFDRWFNKKSDEVAYVTHNKGRILSFLYLKVEGPDENYSDIDPMFRDKRRLKIGTFKVITNGFRLGERFLKIIFDNALRYKVDEIYVTIFKKSQEQKRLITLLEDWGFVKWGVKKSTGEIVLIRDFSRSQKVDENEPKKTFPFISQNSKIYIVPIYPEYHTELFPDSILRNESPVNFVENRPHRNALSKVYISRSHFKLLNSGDIIVFYMTGGIHKGVVTTYGIVEDVIDNIPNLESFVKLCKKRSVFTDEELKRHWDYYPKLKPFVVKFIYAYTFRKRPNLKWLIENGIIKGVDDVPRGFMEISRENFSKIAQYSIGR